MATTFAPSPLQTSSRQQFLTPHSPPQQQRRLVSRQRFIQDFSQCLFEFVIQLLPTAEEMAVKEDVRKLLERLIRTIEPDSRLLSFGSSANGFSLKNSDMDLCCLIDSGERLNAADLVTMVGDLLERETKFHVKPLPHARIPIVKLNLDPSSALPFGIACDIGFENRLALENTRLLMCYASIDPARVRTMVLFLKVWSKRRKINSPYKGTLSSYGYVLLVIYFLVHVKNPPVLPNLQQMPPLRPISEEESHLNGYNIWFFDDIELLRQRWKSSNTDTVADLLIDFFKFYSRDFAYNTGVASIRAGLLKKEDKGWLSEPSDYGTARERNRLCIEDPFETDFNVARCVTKDGLYTIRGEFMRASRILQARPERAILALAQLCEERKDESLGPPPPQARSTGPPRLASVPPQTPYTVGSSPMRVPVPAPEELASRKLSQISSPTSPTPSSPNDSPGPLTTAKDVPLRLPIDKLDHMAPIRSKWTSPPPPEAPEEDRSAYEDRLGQSLAFATVPRGPRPREYSYASSNNSDIVTDDERQSIAESDDVRSVQSFVEEGAVHYSREYRERERQLASLHAQQAALQQRLQQQYGIDPSSSGLNGGLPVNSRLEGGVDIKMISRLRGRPAARVAQQVHSNHASGGRTAPNDENRGFTPPPRMDTHTPRRSMSFPVRNPNRFSLPAMSMVATNPLAASAYQTHLSPTVGQMSPRYVLQAAAEAQAQANVYYEAVPPRDRMYRAAGSYSTFSSPDMSFDEEEALHSRAFARLCGNGGQSPSRSPPESGRESPIVIRRNKSNQSEVGMEEPVAGPSRLPIDAPVPTSPHLDQGRGERMYSHHHSHSNATITAPTPPANVHHFSVPASIPMSTPSGSTLGPRHSNSQSQSRSRSPPFLPTQRNPPHPYTYPAQYPSPRMGAANLPPRLRADRERSLGLASHAGVPDQRVLSAQAQAQAEVMQLRSEPHAHAHAHLRSNSPFASHSLSSGSASPPMSCNSSQYAPSSSPLSTSPPSPARSELKSEREIGGVGVVSPLRSPIPMLDEPVTLPDVQELHEKIGADTPVPVVVTPAPASSPVPPAPSASPAPPASPQQPELKDTEVLSLVKSKTEPVEAKPPIPVQHRSDSVETVIDEVKSQPVVEAPRVLVTESSPVLERGAEDVPEGSKPQGVTSGVAGKDLPLDR
ncbi:hypothetical protein L226DRAFT_602363 [Lentinus tigrinus ALCF2SS1-7]|uniref:uncharacterized protein n=1 Tax=Lentinus tigrinus ALCF2SS1-7 TaxID=1328758 RepID=UPI001165DF83|nr:hypothetical protein L226DRAFT_602363 [Lentinus tigrinus ALCF2SS1-7]